ncbi:MAG: hypothetical protein U1E17_11000 [Geminicoccaceae bacterium]
MTEPGPEQMPSVELCAVVVAVAADVPRVLIVRQPGPQAGILPSGPLQPSHRTLERGLRAWVEEQTGRTLGYVEQLYTFGDQNRRPLAPGTEAGRPERAISVAYLALIGDAEAAAGSSEWRDWHDCFPWEDRRGDGGRAFSAVTAALAAWAGAAPTPAETRLREERVRVTFGDGHAWDNERVLERYELAYEAGLVVEAWRDRGLPPPSPAALPPSLAMAGDCRRILATAIGRLRAKIKYRPVLFELMPPAFTLLQLQRTAEAISGVELHKQNFRRLVEREGLVEEAEGMAADTGGRPARLMRFRREVVLERPAPGVRLGATRRASLV